MGDGAKWIKNLTNYFKFNPNTNVIYSLDKYHLDEVCRLNMKDIWFENIKKYDLCLLGCRLDSLDTFCCCW